ncbi:MAG: Stp1/IreP family PP2C-type Ser/Thr phosphatase [Lachnospiraceae bacterium]|nr:Stp1/IreP family PP2C-type Ser/Thr phosphatase [Lachnospiraceae bacterium]MCI9471192.1 Stp1/IreP family PP2C-type Ser/Thr phosphatase [Lachnospiraceae bacterium]
MRVYAGKDIGQRRQVNQDYVYASVESVGNLPNLFVVADGMGGHNAGDYASSCAVQELVDTIKKNADYNPVKIIRYGMESANLKVLDEAGKSEERKGMGTTMVVATIIGNYVYVANVGDSRLYVIHQGIHQITKDHSLVQEMVRMGELREEEARDHPDKNIITRALGVARSLDVDFFDLEIGPDTMILMCSDGLSNMVTNEEIADLLERPGNVKEKGKALIRLANANGGKDNIAVVLIEPFTKEVEK